MAAVFEFRSARWTAPFVVRLLGRVVFEKKKNFFIITPRERSLARSLEIRSYLNSTRFENSPEKICSRTSVYLLYTYYNIIIQ